MYDTFVTFTLYYDTAEKASKAIHNELRRIVLYTHIL